MLRIDTIIEEETRKYRKFLGNADVSVFYSDVDGLKERRNRKKIDEFIKNVRNAFYSGEPHRDYYGDRGWEE